MGEEEAEISEETEGPLKASLLLESDFRKNGSKAEVILIESGWSLNGRYYSEQVLREAMPIFERKPISVYGFGDSAQHLDQSYRDFQPGFVSDIAGWAVNVREGKGDRGRFALIADFEVARQDIRDLLLTADKIAEGAKYPLGLSIDAQGTASRGIAEGRSGLVVKRIEYVFEVTLVDRPAAGGKILRLTASRDGKDGEKAMKLKNIKDFLLRFSAGLKPGEIATMQEGDVVAKAIDTLHEMDGNSALLKLAIQFLQDGKTEEALTALQALIDDKDEEPEVAEAPFDALGGVTESIKAIHVELAQAKLSRMLAESKLPEKAQASLRKRFAGVDFAEKTLIDAIDDVRELMSEAAPKNGLVQRRADVSIMHDAQDKLAQSLDLILGYDPVKDTSLSESVRGQYVGLRGSTRSVRTLIESYDSLAEASTSDFPKHLGDSINRKLKQEYGELPSFFDDVITVTSVEDFKDQKILQWGGFSQFPVVGELQDYKSLGFPGEEESTFKASKRGGTVSISREMLKNDDLDMLRRVPQKLARAARHQINAFKGGFVSARLVNNVLGSINSSTTYDGKVIYHADHFNVGTDALAADKLMAALLKLDSQRDFGLVTALGSAIVDGSDVTITVVSNLGFQVGDDIQIQAEILRVTSVNVNGTELGVSRGAYGTIAAGHANSLKVYQRKRCTECGLYSRV